MSNTSFSTVYQMFFDKITDDMYLEYTEFDTKRDCQAILLNAISKFEFPRVNLFDYTLYEPEEGLDSTFNMELTVEEINILAHLMREEWLDRQMNSIELTRQKYYGSDFKLTSQAAHLAQLKALYEKNKQESLHLQRLYKRRKIEDGQIKSNWSVLIENRVQDGNNI